MNACLSTMESAKADSAPMPAGAMPSVLQLRSSAGLYGADRMVLTLNHALASHNVSSRLLSINNYRMLEQPLHEAARGLHQDARLLPCRGRLDMQTLQALMAQIDARSEPLLHAHDYKSAFYAWLAGRRRRLPLVATLHGWVDASHSERFYNRFSLVLLRRFDALVVVASAQIAPLVQAGIPRKRIHQIDNGIEFPSAIPGAVPCIRGEFGLAGASYVFGAVARLSPEKNLSMLLDAFAKIAVVNAGIALVIAGDGPEGVALRAQAKRLGVASRVHFIGERKDMGRIYPMFDCLVLPSLSEGMPLAVLEAMSSALPVIASSVGDVPRLLANSASGRLVPRGDLQALQTAMQAALAEPCRRDNRASRYVLDHHSPAAMAARYVDVYRSLQARDHG